jgi:hypothetical protein
VVARTEALIAGLGQDEALRRGAAYAEAGADAVLIHSKERTPDEILEFCHAWSGSVPLVLVPTAYPQLSFANVAALRKVGLIICANHAIRAAVAAMRATFARILAEGGIAGVESSIASVAEIFTLQGDDRMRELERRFLRSVAGSVRTETEIRGGVVLPRRPYAEPVAVSECGDAKRQGAKGGPHGGGGPDGTPLRLGTRSRHGGGRPAQRRFTVGGSGKSVARCHRTVLAYWKFESISLQERVMRTFGP